MNKSRYDKYAKYKTSKEYGLVLLPNVDINNNLFFKITFKNGDRLDLIAKKYFKNSTFWWIIAIVNNLVGDSLILEPGTELYIPRNHLRYVY